MDLRTSLLVDSIDSDSDFEFENDDSSSDEEDDEVLVLAYLYAPGKDLPRRKIPRITNYIDVTVIKYNAYEFKSHFRYAITSWILMHLRYTNKRN